MKIKFFSLTLELMFKICRQTGNRQVIQWQMDRFLHQRTS